jgi:hypothetical protein
MEARVIHGPSEPHMILAAPKAGILADDPSCRIAPSFTYAAHPETQFFDRDDFNTVSRSQSIFRLGIPDLAVNTHPEQSVRFGQNLTATVQERFQAGLYRPVHGANREKINPSREDQNGSIRGNRDRQGRKPEDR